MAPPVRERSTVAAKDGRTNPLPTDINRRLIEYDTLLGEWYALSRRRVALEASDDPIANARAGTIRRRLRMIRTEVDRLVDEFDPDEFDYIMRHVLEK